MPTSSSAPSLCTSLRVGHTVASDGVSVGRWYNLTHQCAPPAANKLVRLCDPQVYVYLYGGTPFVFDNWVDQKSNGVQKHGGNMKGTCVMKSKAKCFEKESQRRNEKRNPIPAGKNPTLTIIERDMRKQGDAAAPLFWHGRLYLRQR